MELNTETLLYVAMGLFFVFILIEMGIIKIGALVSKTQFRSARGYRPRLIHPEYGNLTVTGAIKVGDALYPLTEEYGPDNPMPIAVRSYENTFPINPDQIFTGSDSPQWLYMDDKSPMLDTVNSMVNVYKKRDETLLFRNAYLENEMSKMGSDMHEKVKEDADYIAEVKKKISPINLPEGVFKRFEKLGVEQ